MNYFDAVKSILLPNKKDRYLIILLIVALFIAGYIIVEATGGTQFAYLHILYVPIILSGFVFSVRGGILAGIIAGLLMSPLIPLNSTDDLTQPFFSWSVRMGFFTLVGAIAGM